VTIGVVARDDVVLVLVGDDGCHDRRARRIHADLLVPVECHKRPGRVDQRVHDGEVEAVDLFDELPVVHARAAQRVGADVQVGRLDGVEVDDVRQVGDVRSAVVVGFDRGRLGAFHVDAAVRDDLVGAVRDPAGGVAVGRPAVRRVVLESAVAGRVVARGDHDAVGLVVVTRGVVDDDREAEGRRRHVVVELVDERVDAVRGEHLERGRLGRTAQPVRVFSDEERAGDALSRAVLDDRLRDRRDVGFIERRVERRTTVAARTEDDLLVGVRDIRNFGVIRRDEFFDVDEIGFLGGQTGTCCHGASLSASTGERQPFD
jgi:hypothetical protein